MTLRRAVFITGIVVLCAWTLLPIYLIALGAVGGRTVVNSWPKPFLPPADLSFGTMRDFLDIAGVWSSALYSVEAAGLCMAFSILLGVPAGYALARFVFVGATAYRLLVLLTRAFPVAILALPLTVGFIRLGLYDTPLGVSLMHTALALPFAVLVSASLFQAIPRELEEAAWVFGCSPVRAFLRVVLPLALPGIVTGIALRSSIGLLGIPFSVWTIVIGHATFCIVTVYNNVLARLRRTQSSLVEASMDLGADGWQTFRFVTLPMIATALVAGGLLAFALSFDEIVVTTFTAGAQNTLPIWIFGNIRLGQQLPQVNVVVLFVIVVSLVPVALARRLTRDTGVLRPSAMAGGAAA